MGVRLLRVPSFNIDSIHIYYRLHRKKWQKDITETGWKPETVHDPVCLKKRRDLSSLALASDQK